MWLVAICPALPPLLAPLQCQLRSSLLLDRAAPRDGRAAPNVAHVPKVAVAIYELMRQCAGDAPIAFHLRHPDYAKEVKRSLKDELVSRMNEARACA